MTGGRARAAVLTFKCGCGSLYRHFDKLGKEEQVQVLKDALGACTLITKP